MGKNPLYRALTTESMGTGSIIQSFNYLIYENRIHYVELQLLILWEQDPLYRASTT